MERRIARLRWVSDEESREFTGIKGILNRIMGKKKLSGKDMYEKMVEGGGLDGEGDAGRSAGCGRDLGGGELRGSGRGSAGAAERLTRAWFSRPVFNPCPGPCGRGFRLSGGLFCQSQKGFSGDGTVGARVGTFR